MKTWRDQNYYEILEVDPQATDEEIRIAYEKLKTTYSPSSPGIYALFTPQEMKEILAKVEEAYRVLSNPRNRNEYDLMLRGEKTEVTIPAPAPAISLHRHLGPAELREALGGEEGPFSGENLRKIREYLSLEADEVARETKIGRNNLSSIEEEDINSLPALVYLKGFLKAYAKVLGLDPYKVIEDYLARITRKGYQRE
ncbi:MAG: hypothetical protein DRG50_03430 [Deltaproteobacteria bacterium]|nr:MAG: hypothetical protein DRG50_03430 [Deltaproteobacteria bacterium]